MCTSKHTVPMDTPIRQCWVKVGNYWHLRTNTIVYHAPSIPIHTWLNRDTSCRACHATCCDSKQQIYSWLRHACVDTSLKFPRSHVARVSMHDRRNTSTADMPCLMMLDLFSKYGDSGCACGGGIVSSSSSCGLIGVEVQAADGAGVVGGHPGVDAGLVESVQARQPPQHLSCLILPQADGAGVGHGVLRPASSMARVGSGSLRHSYTAAWLCSSLSVGQHSATHIHLSANK
jgi:hypothetical protein